MTSTRRQFLTRATACGTAAAMGLLGHRSAWAAEPSEWVMDAPLLTLKDAGAASGILVGCAVDAKQLAQSYDYAALVRSQTNMVVAENAFKFGPMRPTPHGFNFFQADQVAEFAHSNNMKLRGHNFVWHRQLPVWFESYATPGNANEILQTHIATVGARYAGQVHSWDVVNEAVELKDGRADGLRNSPWLQLLGPGYIDAAFVAARKADPRAHLFYNEYGIEGEDDASAKKREVVLALLAGMQRRGVPVDGLGIQSHLVAGQTYGPGVRSLVRAAHQMGLRVQLTELDVDDHNLARDACVPR